MLDIFTEPVRFDRTQVKNHRPNHSQPLGVEGVPCTSPNNSQPPLHIRGGGGFAARPVLPQEVPRREEVRPVPAHVPARAHHP